MNFMMFCLLNHYQRLVVGPLIEEHRLVETEPNPAVAVRATKEVAADPLVVLSRHLVVADRAGRNVPEVAVGAYRREDGSDDIAAVLTSLTKWLSDFLQIEAIVVSVLAQQSSHLIWEAGGKLKIGALQFVAVRTV
jgi:hypothetical protein